MNPELLVLFPISIACDVLGQILFKLGADGRSIGGIAAVRAIAVSVPPAAFIVLGLITYAVETFVWLRILSMAPLSIAFPIAATNFLGVTLAGRYLFGERVGRWQWLGVALVTLGVVAVASS